MAKTRFLSLALVVFGSGFLLIYPLALLWPEAWAWHHGSPFDDHYFMMIVGIYATLGLFLIGAARDPLEHLSLIWFTVWSSIVHALIMGAQALADPGQRMHLIGDVPALLFTGIAVGIAARLAVSEPCK
jgi:hypothetical protein